MLVSNTQIYVIRLTSFFHYFCLVLDLEAHESCFFLPCFLPCFFLPCFFCLVFLPCLQQKKKTRHEKKSLFTLLCSTFFIDTLTCILYTNILLTFSELIIAGFIVSI
jgi:hypothetical protein